MTNAHETKVRRIVVGVDGSPSSAAALRWAVAEAKVTGDTLEAIIAWQYPITTGGLGWAPVVMDETVNLESFAEKTLAQTIEDATGPDSAVKIERRVVEGYAPSVLVDA